MCSVSVPRTLIASYMERMMETVFWLLLILLVISIGSRIPKPAKTKPVPTTKQVELNERAMRTRKLADRQAEHKDWVYQYSQLQIEAERARRKSLHEAEKPYKL